LIYFLIHFSFIFKRFPKDKLEEKGGTDVIVDKNMFLYYNEPTKRGTEVGVIIIPNLL